MILSPSFGASAAISGLPYVSVFDDAIAPSVCRQLIQKFEENVGGVQVETTFPGVRHFMEVDVSRHWNTEHEILVNYVQEAWKVYMQTHSIQFDIQWPKQFGYENFRMKQYLPNGRDEFSLHTDVGSYASARRFLSFLWYLNTVEEGGSTQFGFSQGKPQVTIPAVRGRLLVFPPLWTHPHWGNKPIGGPKYIISGYLHLL
jgi:hypothetical protein